MPHKFDSSIASAKAVKKQVEAKGLPTSNKETYNHHVFDNAASKGDAPDAPADGEPVDVPRNLGPGRGVTGEEALEGRGQAK